MKTLKHNNLTWHYFKEPSADDVLTIQKKYNLHPLIIEEFSTPTLRPKATEFDNCLFLSIHLPLFDTENKTTYPAEIDIVICEGALITSHDSDIFQLTELFNELKNSKKKRELYMSQSPGALLRYIIEMLLESCFPKLDHIAEKLNHIEDEIFAGHEKEMVFEISLAKRDILNFRRTMKPQRSVFESLAQKDFRLIEPGLKPYFQDLIGTNIRIWNNLESAKETIESLEETNNSLLSNKLDMTMKVLTIFSAVMLPMTVYSGILAMSVNNIPLGKDPNAFWVHLSIMIVISIITISIFKFKKWL
ncbi:MAG TPA: magnesium transporter CorA family protein [Candidatus Moranbacteria bacterium]|nr:magnesium transporter CorA family protein [Candidatus Moranbacteria bacterium]